jgi:hypothetical protein
MNRIKQVMRKPLSESDLRKILGSDTKVIVYPDLAKYNTLDQLLPKPYDFVIVLLLETPTSGHWCALIKNPSQYEWFDSYGNPPDYDLSKWLSPSERISLKEDKNYLTNLLQGRNYVYNKIKYQQLKQGVNTCGDHVSYRCYKFKNEGYNLKDYQDHIKNYSRLYGLTPDQIVANFVSKYI